MAQAIKLKKLKEGVDLYEVNELLVSPGQTVEKGQPLLVVGADKSNMEVEAPELPASVIEQLERMPQLLRLRVLGDPT